jgi:hypothetical protein
MGLLGNGDFPSLFVIYGSSSCGIPKIYRKCQISWGSYSMPSRLPGWAADNIPSISAAQPV